jgi:hypothetical protein
MVVTVLRLMLVVFYPMSMVPVRIFMRVFPLSARMVVMVFPDGSRCMIRIISCIRRIG